jgi:glycosyltransferase involved in cell wall biosynthesis
MKISLVAQQPSSHDKIWLREMSHALQAAGHDVTVETGTADNDFLSDADADAAAGLSGGSWEHTDEERLAAVPDQAAWLRAKWRRNRPDVVHALRWTGGLTALSATRGLDVPVVQSFGSLALSEGGQNSGPERRRMEAAIGRSATAVLAASADEAADLVRMGVTRRSVTIVPMGIDAARFTPEGPAAPRGELRRIIMVGDLAEHMGTAVRALTRLPGAELLIVGGPDKDTLGGNDEYLALTKLGKTLGVDDRVTFAGHVGYDELPAMLRSADLMVATATHEPDGMAVLAAMACGLPVVACATSGALSDIIIDGTTGLLVPEGRPAQLADRIRKLLAHPMLLSGMTVAAVDRAQSRFAWDRIAAEALTAYGLGAPHIAAAA